MAKGSMGFSNPSKRFRPPNLTLPMEKRPPPIEIEPESPDNLQLSDDDEFHDLLQLSSSDSSDSLSPVVSSIPALALESSDEDGPSDDISRDIAALEKLRKSVQTNLRLRPIRSRSSLPKVDVNSDPFPVPKSPMLLHRNPLTLIPDSSLHNPRNDPISATSPDPSTAYFTPATENFLGQSSASLIPQQTPSPGPPQPRATSPNALSTRLQSKKRPLLIDTRPLAAYLSSHIRYSINIAIPSLILKRCRKPGGGFQTLDALRQFVTTDKGRNIWDELMGPGGCWDGDVVVYDDEMNPKDKDNAGVIAWALIPVLGPLLSYGCVDYLEGGISSASHNQDLQPLVESADETDTKAKSDEPSSQAMPPGIARKSSGLFQLDTQTQPRSTKILPEIETTSATSPHPPSLSNDISISSPKSPTVPYTQKLSPPDFGYTDVMDATPSPPPSSINIRRSPPQSRAKVPNLRRIETKSTERLGSNVPKLTVRTRPLRSATLTIPPSITSTLQAPASPSHLNLVYSNHSPPISDHFSPISPSINDPTNYLSAYYTPPHTPGTPVQHPPPSPSTARPEPEQPLTTEESFHTFTISTILPNFLYLGPELTLQEHVEELQELGVRRILNIAAECDDDHGLNLREVFEKYVKIPMRDTVEEENIAKGVKEVCEILDDARLHSAPTYVHCKAGKSRSVTAVMAYLIHANHWTLSRAYAFVKERRKGISPNIGFVSELMTFEEQELGGKSIGVQPTVANGNSAQNGDSGGDSNYGVAAGGNPHRRGAHVRESLPPALVGGLDPGGANNGSISAGGIMERVFGDSGQEMEIKDSSGRYRHARRAPVDENTLQPMRRVSKAGLESSAYA